MDQVFLLQIVFASYQQNLRYIDQAHKYQLLLLDNLMNIWSRLAAKPSLRLVQIQVLVTEKHVSCLLLDLFLINKMGICCSEQFYGTTSSSDAELIKQIEKPKNQKTIADPISKINAIAKTAPKLDISKNCLLTKRKEHTLTRSLSNLSTDGSPEDQQQNNNRKNKKKDVQRNRSLGPVAFKREMDSFNATNQNQLTKSKDLHKQKSNKNQNCNIKEKSGIQ